MAQQLLGTWAFVSPTDPDYSPSMLDLSEALLAAHKMVLDQRGLTAPMGSIALPRLHGLQLFRSERPAGQPPAFELRINIQPRLG